MARNEVTLRDVYDIVNRVEEKMDRTIGEVKKDVSDLKSFRDKAVLIASIFTTGLSLVFNLIWKKFVEKN